MCSYVFFAVALRIHVSSSVQEALTILGGFHMESRGLTEVKVSKT